MATEQDPLLRTSVRAEDSRTSSHRRRCCPALPKGYENTCVTTRGALVALLWSVVVNSLGVGVVLLTTTMPAFARSPSLFTIVCCYYIIALLLYPVAALLGELRWTRFASLLVGSIIVGIGAVAFVTLLSLYIARYEIPPYELAYYERLSWLILIPVLLVVPGLGLFQSNILQYGSDQLDFASSDVLSPFVTWYYWTCYLFPGIVLLLLSVVTYIPDIVFAYVPVGAVFLALLCITICCCCCHPGVRMSCGDHQVNLVKLIWRVSQFARKSKNHVFCSAFTYNEMPSRLDLAKQRYGGPFTTREVEDVKSFWQLFILLLSLIGFQLRDDTTFPLTLSLLQPSDWYLGLSGYRSAWAVSALVIIVCIPVYQLIIRPFFSQYIPKMLTRMKLGLLVEILSLLITTVCSGLAFSGAVVWDSVTTTYCNNSDNTLCSCNYFGNGSTLIKSSFYSAQYHQWYFEQATVNDCVSHIYFLESSLSPPVFIWLIPQALNGLAHMLVFLTSLEFIFAQAPHTMQGFLIGLWYAMQSINVGISVIANVSGAFFYWEYYAVKTLLVFLSIILFFGVSRRYKYKKLNEDIDVNVQQEIEGVFERNIDREAEFEQEQLQHESTYIVESMH